MARSSRLESGVQDRLIADLKKTFPEATIFKINPFQGCPDLLILEKDKWAMLETKRGAKATHRPNQDYYVSLYNNQAYCSFVHPANKEQVITELVNYFNGPK